MNAHRVSRRGRRRRRVPVARARSRANADDADDDADADDDDDALATSLARDATRVDVDATARVTVVIARPPASARARGRSVDPNRAHTHTPPIITRRSRVSNTRARPNGMKRDTDASMSTYILWRASLVVHARVDDLVDDTRKIQKEQNDGGQGKTGVAKSHAEVTFYRSHTSYLTSIKVCPNI
jgi:hypothetical protein